MKIIEERKLKTIASKIRKTVKSCEGIESLYAQVDTFKSKSLQDLSFQSDLKFFDEINGILSVIISIVSKPHLAIKNEEIVLRSEQASQLQPYMFKKTMADSKMWKRKNNGMVPEYVYFNQSSDEINTMENQFVVMVVDLIADELLKYEQFYVEEIESISKDNKLSLRYGQVDVALERINFLTKKLRMIKSTYFYKTISRKKVKFKHVTPTNILLKDKLYKFVFKFYRKIITYKDSSTLMKDLTLYFYLLIIQEVKELGFDLSSVSSNNLVLKKGKIKIKHFIYLENDDFKLKVRKHPDYDGFQILVKNKKMSKYYEHMLFVDSKSKFTLPLEFEKDKYISINAVSIFIRARLIGSQFEIIDRSMSEADLIKDYFQDLTMLVKGTQKIYSKYCPNCKQKNVEEESNIYCCDDCGTIYTFVKNKDEIYFIDLRRDRNGK